MCRPRENHNIQLQSFTVSISPPHLLRWIRDAYENNVGLLDLTEPASELIIESESYVKVQEENPGSGTQVSPGLPDTTLRDARGHASHADARRP